ncbi:MAG TPA: phenylalanine--tRNA ligase subunit beta [Burkholderiales bacterium]|nr:phenylalanine--tRNA ligase subunit beta [Burkholderiales bacterium]
MRVSENWLREYVNPDIGTAALAHALTMAGVEVEAIETAGEEFSGVVAGKVVSVSRHPNADRLSVCRVEVGSGEPLQIVCGAPNVEAGMMVPCALVGARLPKLVIGLGKLRGIESQGMLCSAKELGLKDTSEGLLSLPEDAIPGEDVRRLYDLDDHILVLKLTPNRSDCLGIEGIAREVAAITGVSFRPLPITAKKADLADVLPVRLEDPVYCPRYYGQVIREIKLQAETPLWIRRRLERCGMRPKNLVVDVTNYVMLELGQPLHAFDLSRVQGGIVVRQAVPGEQLTLLDGQVVALDDALVIADYEHPLAIAGVMGGLDSAVSEKTQDVFLESAWFSPEKIAGRARMFNLVSEAAYRFERGVDPALAHRALDRAAHLILQYGGGSCGPVTMVGKPPVLRQPLLMRLARLHRMLGMDIAADEVNGIFTRLGFDPKATEDGWWVTPPGFRFDLSNEADLVEEVARLFGYDRIEPRMPMGRFGMLPSTESVIPVSQLHSWFVARDYQEIITYSFVDAAWEHTFGRDSTPLKLKNPISSQMSVMRSTLFGGLVDCLRSNLNYKQERVRIFEVGRVFVQGEKELEQPMLIGGLCYGDALPQQWASTARKTDFFDVKADIEKLNPLFRFVSDRHPALHPTQTARIELNGMAVGWLGVLHPKWCQQYDLTHAPVLFEMDLQSVRVHSVPRARPLSKQPLVRRDLAIIVDVGLSWQEVLDEIHTMLPEQVVEISLFDEYRGKGIDTGKKSLAFKVMMQDTQKTLTDSEVDGIMLGLTGFLAKRFGAVLRA